MLTSLLVFTYVYLYLTRFTMFNYVYHSLLVHVYLR